MTEQKYDAMFSFGIKDEDISFEIDFEESGIVPVIFMIDDENEKLPSKLLFQDNGLPKPRKPILYQWIQDSQIDDFNINPLLEPYNNIYLRITKEKFMTVAKKFGKKEIDKIKKFDIFGHFKLQLPLHENFLQ